MMKIPSFRTPQPRLWREKRFPLFHCGTLLMAAGLLCVTALKTTARDAAPQAVTPLKAAFKGQFLLGTILDYPALQGRVPQDVTLATTHFNALTPANSLKPDSVQHVEGKFTFAEGDRLVEIAEKSGAVPIGHTLVWHQQTPRWFFEGPNGQPANRELALARLRSHIATVVGHFKGRIKQWDVVNEAISDAPGELLRPTPWLKAIGPDYIAEAFRAAHQADPDALLIYNDYNIELGYKRPKALELLKSLLAQGVPINAVGLQCHWRMDNPDLAEVENSITQYAALGLKVMITELDIGVLPTRYQGADISTTETMTPEQVVVMNPYTNGLPAAVAQEQAARYRQAFEIFLRHKDVIGRVTLWGTSDKESWLNNFPVRGRTDYPLLFDRANNPKPAFFAVQDAGQRASAAAASAAPQRQTATSPAPNTSDTPKTNQNPGGTLLSAPPPAKGHAQTVANPIIWADVPDMAMIRVGNTYYMSSTTMHMSPGLPIMKSTDLVHWQRVSYAYATLGDNDALTLQNGKNAYGAGSWASSLRYHNATFYVSTFSSTTGKTSIYSARDVEHGPWQESSFSPALHDHSLFFDDDGRVYMIHGSGNIRLTELNADLSGIKRGGIDQVIIPNASQVAGDKVGLPAEGSQMLKVGGKYFLFNIVWPSNSMRTEIVHRADKITGPYTGRIALKDQVVAQGSLIDTPEGDWYAYMFQDHGAVGRVPFLVPVKWQDVWPILGNDGKVPATLTVAGKAQVSARAEVSSGAQELGGAAGMVASDNFTRTQGQAPLPLAWQWNHNPDNRFWSVSQCPGFLRLTTGRTDSDLLSARNSLTQRTFGPQCEGSVALDVSGMKDGDCAGLGALQKRYGFVGVKQSGNAKSLVVVNAESDIPQEVASVPLTQNKVWLKVACDYRNRADKAYFSYSFDGKTWLAFGKPLQMVYTLPHFMGYRLALFNYATKAPGGFVDFDYFHVNGKGTSY